LSDFTVKSILNYPGKPNVIIKVCTSEGEGHKRTRGAVIMEEWLERRNIRLGTSGSHCKSRYFGGRDRRIAV
jgi:hypothetical protein